MSRPLDEHALSDRRRANPAGSAVQCLGVASARDACCRRAHVRWRAQFPLALGRALALAAALAIATAVGAENGALAPQLEPGAAVPRAGGAIEHVQEAVGALSAGLKAAAADPAIFAQPLEQNAAQPLGKVLSVQRDASGQAVMQVPGNGSVDAAITHGNAAHMGDGANSSSSGSSLSAANHGSDAGNPLPEKADALEHSAGNIHGAQGPPAGQIAGVGVPAALQNQPGAPAGDTGGAGHEEQRAVAPLAGDKQPSAFERAGGGAVGSDQAPLPPAAPAAVADGGAGMVPGGGGAVDGHSGGAGGVSDAADDSALVCETGDCLDLGTRLIDTVEGEDCRSLLVTGRCPRTCFIALQGVVQHTRWAACATRCRKDVVEGAADRWLELCDVHVESLLDKGKEVVKKIVGGDGLPRLRVWSVAELLAGLVVLVGAVAVGYRRGASAAHRSQRLRMRHARKNSHERVAVAGSTLSGVV
jgi:hypothetical protein